MSALTSPLHAALRCLFIIALHHGLEITPQDLIAGTDASDPIGSLLKVMKRAGFRGSVLRSRKWKAIVSLGTAYPAIAGQKDGNWVVVVNTVNLPGEESKLAVLDPLAEQTGIVMVDRERFLENWDGTIILCKRVYADGDSKEPFGFRWFLPEILMQAHYYRDIAITSIVGNVIGYFTPFLMQIMIDKVVSHHSYNTLVAVMLVYVILTFFDMGFSFIKQNLTMYASTKIDARLTSRTFSRLLSLPLTFFETNTAGILIRNVNQAGGIRGFLTGRLFQTALDLLPMPVLLVLLSMYSLKLTLVVLVFSAIIAATIALMLPIYKHHLDQMYQVEGARQAHLVETIVGMRTIKSLVLGPSRLQEWDLKISQSMRRLMTVGRVSSLGTTFTDLLERIMQLAILGVGAQAVFDGDLTIGSLVAFNMLSGRVSGPLIGMVSLINEYQQMAMSVQMLGTVMNHPPERELGQRYIYPRINGEIEFEEVTFTYPGAASPALDRVSFRIEPGQMIGVVGRSGSGKSTLTRLIQGISPPDSGLVKVSGADIRHIDLDFLRRNTGVVLQDNFLFRGTIRENITMTKPEAGMDEIMEAARKAGAAEFIDRLPNSYGTFVQENATNFSGGQRQRIAIARALLPEPQLMIFDEATSALDPESEAIVQENLDKIAHGRTMVVVSHRLSSLVNADAILVMDQGKVVDFAPHRELVERCEIYKHLWEQQTRHIF